MSESFISLPATEVLRLANETLEGIANHRAKRIANEYDDWTTHWLFGPRFYRLFSKNHHLKLTTEERETIRLNLSDQKAWPDRVQVWAKRDEDDIMPEVWSIMTISYGHQESTAKKLIALANAVISNTQSSSAVVNITSSDYKKIDYS